MRKTAKDIAAALLLTVGFWSLPLETLLHAEGEDAAQTPDQPAQSEEPAAEPSSSELAGTFTTAPSAASPEIPTDQRVQASLM
jgi:hypothetical protein